MKNINIKLIVTLTAIVSLLATIIATPAMAQDKSSVIVMPVAKIVVKPCKVRSLDQGSGNVKICE